MSYDPPTPGGGGLTLASLRLFTFTGDGVTTAFSTGEALHVDPARLQIHRNGMRLRSGVDADYTATPTTVTFTTPPATGATIVVTGWLASA